MSERDVVQLADELTRRVANGELLLAAMRDVSLRHAARLREMGPVRVLALDPCPRCGGNVIASDDEAKCASGCEWSYRRHGRAEGVEPRGLARRRGRRDRGLRHARAPHATPPPRWPAQARHARGPTRAAQPETMVSTLLLLLRIEAALCALFGLWSHSWGLILAGGFCWAISPLLRHELKL